MRSSDYFSRAGNGTAVRRAIATFTMLIAFNVVAAKAQDAPPPQQHPPEENATGGEGTSSEEGPLRVFEPRGRVSAKEAECYLYYLLGCVLAGLLLFLVLYWKYYNPPSWMQTRRESRRKATPGKEASGDEQSEKESGSSDDPKHRHYI